MPQLDLLGATLRGEPLSGTSQRQQRRVIINQRAAVVEERHRDEIALEGQTPAAR